MQHKPHKPIFFDASGRRAAHISIIGWIAAVLSTLIGLAFLASIVAVPHFTALKLPGQLSAVPSAELEKQARSPELLRAATHLGDKARALREKRVREKQRRLERAQHSGIMSAILEPQQGRALSIAFYPTWGSTNFASLQRALPHLDWVVPTWLNLAGPQLTLKPVLRSARQRLHPGHEARGCHSADAAERLARQMGWAGPRQAAWR